jgi:NAD(P)-dependent dehydrogenase (short-subunit alcohol dehydrogenase family)
MHVSGMVHVNVNCSDFDRFLAFSRRLGFELVAMVPETNTPEVAAAVGMPPYRVRGGILRLPGETTLIDLLEWQEPSRPASSSAKAAVEMWVRTVATEPADDLVRVAAVRPGVVATGMQAEIRSSDEADFPSVERFRALHASGALADPAEIGARIWGLAVDPDWANGAFLDVTQLG